MTKTELLAAETIAVLGIQFRRLDREPIHAVPESAEWRVDEFVGGALSLTEWDDSASVARRWMATWHRPGVSISAHGTTAEDALRKLAPRLAEEAAEIVGAQLAIVRAANVKEAA